MSYDYDLIVIGGGAAGLTASGLGASFGAKTLLVEQDRLGGDCTWTGCVPSKTLLKSASVAHRMRRADAYGLPNREPDVDFEQVMEHVRETRRHVYEDADAPENLEEFGVEVQHGAARFTDPHALAIETEDGSTLRRSARHVVIAAGGRPAAPPIDGLEEVNYHTTETLFEMREQPKRLAVLGAGPIGTEMAQAFARLGTEVTVIDRADGILQHDNRELAGRLRAVLDGEGVRYVLGADVRNVSEDEDAVTVTVDDGERRLVTADALLVATGRRPNTQGLGLNAAGVAYDEQGVTVDDRCRTSRRHIFAAGDVTGRYQFTHMSEHMAKVAASNALLKVPQSIDSGRVPWVTYTDPELAHVGATEAQLRDEEASFEMYRFPFDRLDRAATEHETTGRIKVFATAWRGKIKGASVLGARAGELIGTFALAMKTGATLRQISDTIFPYPTYGQGVRRAADQWYAQKQRPWLVRGLQRVFGYRGPVQEPDPNRIV